MHKLSTFLKYLSDFIKWREYRYIFTSIKYILFHKTTTQTRIYRSSLGIFLSRKAIMESKYGGRERLAHVLHEIVDFEILEVDDLNMGARKITDKTQNHADT